MHEIHTGRAPQYLAHSVQSIAESSRWPGLRSTDTADYIKRCVWWTLLQSCWSSCLEYPTSHMRFMNHNWSATKQHLHPQSVAKISRHSFLSADRFDNVEHRLGLATRTQISVCKSPFPSAGTAVSLFRAKTVQQRPLLPREVEAWLPDCGVAH